MVKILAVCGNGLGTSMLIKTKIQKYLDSNGINGKTDSCSLADSEKIIGKYDIILCSRHLAAMLLTTPENHVVGLNNLMDQKEFGPKIMKIITEKFADSMN